MIVAALSSGQLDWPVSVKYTYISANIVLEKSNRGSKVEV